MHKPLRWVMNLKFRRTILIKQLGRVPLPLRKPLDSAAHLYLLRPLYDPSAEPLEDYEFNEKRNQYDASRILTRLMSVPKPKDVNYILYVTGEDLYAGNLNFVFGVALKSYGIALLSTYRLKQGAGLKLFEERIFKEAAHEIGHLMGLGHCIDPSCLMSFSNSLLEVDQKLPMLCKECIRAAGLG